MVEVGVHEAKTTLSKLLRRVAAGEEVVITNGGRPAARLVAVLPREVQRIGLDKGRIHMSDDFDEIPDDFSDYI